MSKQTRASWWRKYRIPLTSTIVASILLAFPVSQLLRATRAELPSLIQACAVIISLAIALTVFRTDSAAKRTDRVHQLHQELTTGEVGGARTRLGHFLRVLNDDPDTVCRVSVTDLELEGAHPKYRKEDKDHMPRRDATTVLRFFERARFAQTQGAVDDRAFVLLVGYQATWWACAIAHRGNQLTYATWQLALWAEAYIEKHAVTDPEIAMLARRRATAFPGVTLPRNEAELTAAN